MPARPTADPPAPRGVVPLLWPAVALVAAVTVGLGIGGLPVLPPPPEESGEAPAAGGGWRPTPVGAEDAEEAVRLFREGNALFQQGDVLQAKALFERAVATDPGHAFSWANLGNVARELGETDSAIGCHERAFQLTATRPRSSYNLAVSLQTAGRYQPAAVMYQKAITLEREGHGELDVSRAYTNLGVCFQGLGQLEDAVEQYALAKQLRPDLRSANLNYCNIMLPLKGSDAAVGCFSSLLDRDPEFEQALSAAAGVHHLSDNLGAAASLYQRALSVNPTSASAQHGLAAISGGGGEVAPEEYVRDMFNGYALTFDDSLKALRYQSPELLRAAIDEHLKDVPDGDAWARRAGSWNVLDGGCGTGLCGPLFRNLSTSLHGVDLSENMVALARKRQVYDELTVSELVEAIRHWGTSAGTDAEGVGEGGDVVLAADVLVYFGNLGPFLTASADAVHQRGGVVAFTTERLDPEAAECQRGGAGWKLTTSGRYSHCANYVEAAAEATGKLRRVRAEDITPRWNRGQPVAGTLFLFRANAL